MSGQMRRLEDFILMTFSNLSLDWWDHLGIDYSWVRPADLNTGCGNPAKAGQVMGRQTPKMLVQMVVVLIVAERSRKCRI